MPEEQSLGSIEVALTPLQRFEEFLRSRGMRNTEQRKILIEHVFSHHEHFDADLLIEKLPRKGQSGYVSRPTVYRTLSEFVDAGLLNKFELDGRAVYEHDYGYPKHDHLYCSKCEKLIEFQSEQIIELLEEVSAKHAFKFSGHRLIVSGICETCRQSKKRATHKVI